MYSTEPIPQTPSQFPISQSAPTTLEQNIEPSTINKIPESDFYFNKSLQLIWNEVNRLTRLGVIRSEEDKWFFAYRKAIGILSGDE